MTASAVGTCTSSTVTRERVFGVPTNVSPLRRLSREEHKFSSMLLTKPFFIFWLSCALEWIGPCNRIANDVMGAVVVKKKKNSHPSPTTTLCFVTCICTPATRSDDCVHRSGAKLQVVVEVGFFICNRSCNNVVPPPPK